MNNPYWRAYRIRLRNYAAAHLSLPYALRWIPVIFGWVLVSMMAGPVWLSFLSGPREEWTSGIQGAFFRLGVAVIMMQCLRMHSVLMRSRERMVLSVLPVEPGIVTLYQTLRCGLGGLWMVPASAVLLGPIALAGYGDTWLLMNLGVFGVWCAALMLSAVVFMGAVGAAESDRWAPLLDLLRGANPREQAAFIYAPGVVLLLLGSVVAAVGYGITEALSSRVVGWSFLALPYVLSVLLALLCLPTGRAGWYRATSVLADIDARYGALEHSDDPLRVYMDWALRFFPNQVAFWALKDMRHGWRQRRTWIVLSWLVGLIGLVAGWSADPAASSRVVFVLIVGLAVNAAVSIQMTNDEPNELRAWLGNGGLTAFWARCIVLLLWFQAAIWPGAFAVGLRTSWEGMGVVLGAGVVAAVSFSVLANLCGRLAHARLVTYISTVTLGLGGVSALLFGSQ